MAIQGSQLEESPRTAAGRWRCVTQCGVWSAMIYGTPEMLLSCADSTDSLVSVSYCRDA